MHKISEVWPRGFRDMCSPERHIQTDRQTDTQYNTVREDY